MGSQFMLWVFEETYIEPSDEHMNLSGCWGSLSLTHSLSSLLMLWRLAEGGQWRGELEVLVTVGAEVAAALGIVACVPGFARQVKGERGSNVVDSHGGRERGKDRCGDSSERWKVGG